jgi:sugar lactone lactonase YvrE
VALDSRGSVISVWGNSDAGDSQVLYPKGMALDANGNLYVASYSNHRVLKYRLP